MRKWISTTSCHGHGQTPVLVRGPSRGAGGALSLVGCPVLHTGRGTSTLLIDPPFLTRCAGTVSLTQDRTAKARVP